MKVLNPIAKWILPSRDKTIRSPCQGMRLARKISGLSTQVGHSEETVAAAIFQTNLHPKKESYRRVDIRRTNVFARPHSDGSRVNWADAQPRYSEIMFSIFYFCRINYNFLRIFIIHSVRI